MKPEEAVIGQWVEYPCDNSFLAERGQGVPDDFGPNPGGMAGKSHNKIPLYPGKGKILLLTRNRAVAMVETPLGYRFVAAVADLVRKERRIADRRGVEPPF